MMKQTVTILKFSLMAAVTVYTALIIVLIRLFTSRYQAMRISQKYLASHWSRQFQKLANLELEVIGALPADGSVYTIVSNHLSYLEAAVIPQVACAGWIGRYEMGLVPVFGQAAAICGLQYVDRRSPESRERTRETMLARYRDGVHLWIFAEGTTSDGTDVLPFKKSMFEMGMDIVPCAIKYRSPGGFNPAWFGDDEFWPHVVECLNQERIQCRVRLFPVMPSSDYRDFTEHQIAVRKVIREWVIKPWGEEETTSPESAVVQGHLA